MTDIAPSFDDAPSKDGGAMPEVRFDDLIPPTRPPPSPFENMWQQARASTNWTYPAHDASSVSDQSVQSPAQNPDFQSSSTASANPHLYDLGQKANRTNPAASLPEHSELNFDDLVPQGNHPLFWPHAAAARQSDQGGSAYPVFGIGHNSDPQPTLSRAGIGHNGGPPLEDSPIWRLLVSRLLGGAGGALVGAVSPSPLNRGDDEYIASIFAWPYGQLKRKLPSDFQANHLNQNAAFRDTIPMSDGISVGMRGNAITGPGTSHYNFHQSLEDFWEPYRLGRELFGKKPTNAMYGDAVKKALQAGGLSPEEAAYLAGRAAEQRARYGLSESAVVPRIPSRMNQARTGEQRLQNRLRESTSSGPTRVDRAKN